MQSKFILLLVLLAVFISCRKETPATLPDNAVYGSTTCNNGIKDGNEDAIDCGGDCDPCITPNPDCMLTNNKVTFAGDAFNDFQIYSSSDIVVDTTTSATQTFINVESSDIDMKFTFSGDAIETFKYYTATASSTPNEDQVQVTWRRSFTDYVVTDGDFYVYTVNGKYVIEFCSVIAYNFGPYYSDGKLTAN